MFGFPNVNPRRSGLPPAWSPASEYAPAQRIALHDNAASRARSDSGSIATADWIDRGSRFAFLRASRPSRPGARARGRRATRPPCGGPDRSRQHPQRAESSHRTDDVAADQDAERGVHAAVVEVRLLGRRLAVVSESECSMTPGMWPRPSHALELLDHRPRAVTSGEQ